MSIEKFNYLIGNDTHDRPACSIEPQAITVDEEYRMKTKYPIQAPNYNSVNGSVRLW
jgi:hypothetical protein